MIATHDLVTVPVAASNRTAVELDVDSAVSALLDAIGLDLGFVLAVILPVLVLLVVGALATGWALRRTSRGPPRSTGPDLFIGRTVTVRNADGTRGHAFVEGSWWTVRSTGTPLQSGDEVQVRGVDGLELVVEQPPDDTPDDTPDDEEQT